MKIGILTQPLHNNYGGLLQNYALQTVLKRLGHDVYTINVKSKNSTKFIRFASILKRSAQRLLGQQVRVRTWATAQEAEVISQHTRQFVNRNIVTTESITRKLDSNLLNNYNFGAYIVGSDQVWRPKYSPQLPTYFLDFLENNTDVIKLAYAASFGVDDWEFTESQTVEFKRLAKLFNAISVREDSGAELCKKYFDVDATHVLDPTMLLDKEVYISLVEKDNIKESPGNLFTYILDSSDEKNSIVKTIANNYNLRPFSVMQTKRFSDKDRQGINDCVFPPVEEWIRGFMDAQFVVTDSFHGTVFSILFNKPFVSIGNKGRGLSRFTSLLKMFNLEDRLIFNSKYYNLDNLDSIDSERINLILRDEREKSLRFLNKYFENNKLNILSDKDLKYV